MTSLKLPSCPGFLNLGYTFHLISYFSALVTAAKDRLLPSVNSSHVLRPLFPKLHPTTRLLRKRAHPFSIPNRYDKQYIPRVLFRSLPKQILWSFLILLAPLVVVRWWCLSSAAFSQIFLLFSIRWISFLDTFYYFLPRIDSEWDNSSTFWIFRSNLRGTVGSSWHVSLIFNDAWRSIRVGSIVIITPQWLYSTSSC